MPTWRSVPAIDGDDVGLVSTAVIGAATVTINRPLQHEARWLLAGGRHRAEPRPDDLHCRPPASRCAVARTS